MPKHEYYENWFMWDPSVETFINSSLYLDTLMARDIVKTLKELSNGLHEEIKILRISANKEQRWIKLQISLRILLTPQLF